MSSPCTVVIAAAELLPALEQRVQPDAGEILPFTDVDALRALETITTRRPGVVALERLFAATPRGAALINRIKADPSLAQCEIRIVSHDGHYSRVSPRRAADHHPDTEADAGAVAVEAPPAAPLDYRGTRRAPRYRVANTLDVAVDGTPAVIVDLSTLGAQVLSTAVLRPNQRVRLTLQDEEGGTVRFNATVAWASFEIPPKGGPRYRAGVEFVAADAAAVDGYCSRHRV